MQVSRPGAHREAGGTNSAGVPAFRALPLMQLHQEQHRRPGEAAEARRLDPGSTVAALRLPIPPDVHRQRRHGRRRWGRGRRSSAAVLNLEAAAEPKPHHRGSGSRVLPRIRPRQQGIGHVQACPAAVGSSRHGVHRYCFLSRQQLRDRRALGQRGAVRPSTSATPPSPAVLSRNPVVAPASCASRSTGSTWSSSGTGRRSPPPR